jgi:hypothetical protein
MRTDMTALNRLAGLLLNTSCVDERPFQSQHEIDEVISKLQLAINRPAGLPAQDIQLQAVYRFWKSQQFESPRDARHVCYGLGITLQPPYSCIMEDRDRFCAVIDKKTGIDQWLENPRWYRRCYQGLVHSYFMYDAEKDDVPATGRRNWEDLRDYLHDRVSCITDPTVNPAWVTTTLENRKVFCHHPCQPYAEAVLNGDTSAVDVLHEHLNFDRASWFDRELILSQIRQATLSDEERFVALIPQLLRLLEENRVLRDRGLTLVLDRYASIKSPQLHPDLRDKAVEWWRNPWLPSNEKHWGGVTPAARAMVSDWLKREFIESFFTKLSQDGLADRRRVNFWLRYAKSMDAIEFALGDTSRLSRNSDFVVLRKKMEGLYTELKSSDSNNNAFIMTMGSLVAVEFSSQSNALYGYDKNHPLPFTLSKPVVTPKDVRNSLKHSDCILWLTHQDNIKGWARWEQRFEAELLRKFGIRPDESGKKSVTSRTPSIPPANSNPSIPPPSPPYRTGSPQGTNTPSGQPSRVAARVPPYSRLELSTLARSKNFRIADFTNANGNLWARTDNSDLDVNELLRHWKFTYKHGKGWWRKDG